MPTAPPLRPSFTEWAACSSLPFPESLAQLEDARASLVPEHLSAFACMTAVSPAEWAATVRLDPAVGKLLLSGMGSLCCERDVPTGIASKPVSNPEVPD